ncbi:hypothetical protein [Acidovorax cavernicola]|uniref:Uncharacterized protein n=1 Tax=Acidovorax cavernicola TaxID=1675792 RepID=A0A9X8D2D4_9BURK|nr:hypothetical protein [Acidovorax cavernicola]RIX76784.1 hypothetical protein D3H34_21145 [Acidovorax cavernicola]
MTSKQTPDPKPASPDKNPPEKFPFPTSDNHGTLPAEAAKPTPQPSSEEALDSGVEESFPASDPVSVTVTKVKLPSDASNEEGAPSPKP